MKRHLLGLLAAIAAVLATVIPSQAADELGVSRNGTTWSDAFSGSIFDNAIQWVPGDSRTATFYIRNQSPNEGSLAIAMLGDHTGDLLDSGNLHVTASAASGVSVPVSNGNEQLMLNAKCIGSGVVVPITVKVDFDESSRNETRLRSTDLRFVVTLTQTSVVSPARGATASLPNTGAPNTIWIVALGSILLGIGVAVTTRRRNNPKGEAHDQ